VPRRCIVRDPLFEDSLAALFHDDTEEGDAYTAAAEDLLSHDPEIGEPTENGVWALPMAPIRGRIVYLFYTFDEIAVLFIALAAFDD
jgi:hypothetical protein